VSTQEYFRPESIEEATSLLANKAQGSLILAGGTLVMPLINDGVSRPDQVLGLKAAGLDYIKQQEGYLIIGATATLSQVVEQTTIPMLAEAALGVGGWAIRNMATVGGNFFAPPPGGDFAAALLALDASLILVGEQRQRSVMVNDFFTGFMTNILQPEEIIKEIRVQIPEGTAAFMKYGRRHANTPSIVTVAVNFDFDGDSISKARIALNAVGPYPFRAKKAEEFLVGKTFDDRIIQEAGEIAVGECTPFTDPIASEWYRRKMIPVILGRTLEKIGK
jgi:CO/xanthine dehydrogenase FAD-binding subunit